MYNVYKNYSYMEKTFFFINYCVKKLFYLSTDERFMGRRYSACQDKVLGSGYGWLAAITVSPTTKVDHHGD